VSARTRVKICGIATFDEALLAVAAGVDALGMILAESPRRVSMERVREIVRAIPAFATPVAVFADPSFAQAEEAIRIGCVPQFCGDELPEECERVAVSAYVKVCRMDMENADADAIARFADRFPRATLLFDSHVAGLRGGTGTVFDWDLVRAVATRRPVIVSGGLTPENVGECVRRVRPYAVDVRSGVETNGKKDPERMAAFVRAVREADAQA
jgi:phosphoribosylanthranilate isomerase